ncbi:protein ANTAGONIST OF LIKE HETEROCHROMATIN PROTEIN 1-like [Teleopsis dalmanni]|uniref:protein ANTAGONIST OF LIKE HETEROCHROMATIN PROTEIN 1-like n=1 Tax=Teleopsis dalmanni TaxID=139649 RepID=UPI0018CED267|nr:protein ANTAGONIST OF LIKE HETEROCHROMATIN PROTEIN 1-like [Teleopsis dalmanni]
MPRKSERAEITKFLIENTILKLRSVEDATSIYDDADEIMDEFHDNLLIVLSNRYCIRTPSNSVPKLLDWHKNVLPHMNDNQFKEMLRVNREQFQHLLTLIEKSEVFQKPYSNKQLPIELQLAIVLYRLGSASENVSTRKIANLFGIGGGGTVDKITRRVFEAFFNILGKYIRWPNEVERSKIVKDTFNELPHCIGYIDTMEIKFAEPPTRDPKTKYKMCTNKLQIVCDEKLRIRHAVVGDLGTFNDAEIFRNSVIYKNPRKFFSDEQWIAGDSTYPLLDHVITPYSKNSDYMDETSRSQFNKQHSKYRVRAEYCINLLMERFCSLKELRLRVDNKRGEDLCKKWVLICCMLHNILLSDDKDFKHILSSKRKNYDIEDPCDGISHATYSSENKRRKIFHKMFS